MTQRYATLWLFVAVAGCGSSDDTQTTQLSADAAVDTQPTDATTSNDTGTTVTCTGTHAPCSVYTGSTFAIQECINHGCSVNNNQCIGTPHACDSLQIQVGASNTLDCGEGHGCNACPACAAGTTCVQTCFSDGFDSKTTCVPSSATCDSCSDSCVQSLCGTAPSGCTQSCAVVTPGAFQCHRL